MQSKYFGDKGDFAKYGLLRYLCALTGPDSPEPDLRLGLVWYLTPDDCCRGDGRAVGFLRDTPANRRNFRNCDPGLWDTLRDIVECGRRCVHQMPRTGILPENTLYFDKPLLFPHGSLRPVREEIRRLWFRGAFQATADADLVMLDPDNGLGAESVKYRQNGPKFAYLDDLRSFWYSGQSIVLYQHLGMDIPAEDFIQGKAREIRGGLNVGRIIALRFTSRVFFVSAQEEHEERIMTRLDGLLAGPWGGHFQEVPNV